MTENQAEKNKYEHQYEKMVEMMNLKTMQRQLQVSQLKKTKKQDGIGTIQINGRYGGPERQRQNSIIIDYQNEKKLVETTHKHKKTQ